MKFFNKLNYIVVYDQKNNKNFLKIFLTKFITQWICFEIIGN